jgi:hypothetical protein
VKRRSLSGLAIAPAALALAAMPAEPTGGDRSTTRELPLLTVAQLGSLSWSCDGRGRDETIRFRAERVSATETVRMQAGSSHRIATLQPGDSTSVRADGARTVRIAIVQGTEARTLRASMTLTFPGPGIRSYCYPYFPPSVALSLHY